MNNINAPLIIAHRGERELAPENTIAGCKLALQQGAQALEVDVRACAGGELVLFHDRYLIRHFGKMKQVANASLEELRKYDFNKQLYQYPAKICTLQEFFEEFKGVAPINVDAKPPLIGLRMALELIRIITQMKMREQVWVSSFNPTFLRIVKELKPLLRTGYLFRNFHWIHRWVDVYADSNAWHPHYSIVTDRFVELTKRLKKEVFVWTVNDEAVLERMRQYNFAGIITDRFFRSAKSG